MDQAGQAADVVAEVASRYIVRRSAGWIGCRCSGTTPRSFRTTERDSVSDSRSGGTGFWDAAHEVHREAECKLQRTVERVYLWKRGIGLHS